MCMCVSETRVCRTEMIDALYSLFGSRITEETHRNAWNAFLEHPVHYIYMLIRFSSTHTHSPTSTILAFAWITGQRAHIWLRIWKEFCKLLFTQMRANFAVEEKVFAFGVCCQSRSIDIYLMYLSRDLRCYMNLMLWDNLL